MGYKQGLNIARRVVDGGGINRSATGLFGYSVKGEPKPLLFFSQKSQTNTTMCSDWLSPVRTTANKVIVYFDFSVQFLMKRCLLFFPQPLWI